MLDNIERTNSRGDAVAPQLYDWEGAASVLGVTPRLVRELWQRRELSGTKVGKRVRFSDADLIAYIDRHRVKAVR